MLPATHEILNMKLKFALLILILGPLPVHALPAEGGNEPPSAADGWHAVWPRDELKPEFSYLPDGGPHQQGSLAIFADQRGLMGTWFRPGRWG